ncbi:bifunctional folylpolyglutamate synthase/dihydrofolate synthase [Proteocatella sphenisci]|uniref:bifunctional folylpolyglutamate synthase/dihydrofolate synthase n=1 Tax=Proteocatella sphenisci TaxID=181070 RepID=UPI000490414A|nr:folylpolyglutamate synthase/dihydrofolate synthase family protein [Proteocatella sphenisci]
MDYRQALNYIENTGKFGSRLGLENVKNLLEILGNPQNNLEIIHVAGTNGKGSTCSYINNMLVYQGYNVGLYTSPYLEEFNERIRINNSNISDEELAQSISTVKKAIDKILDSGFEHPTEFEIITATAYLYFSEKNVDFAVIEVGLGGRLDATNVCTPVISAITSIGMDHTQYLGETLAEIAFEKAGIIKENIPVVLYQQSKEVELVISEICNLRKSDLYITQNDNIEYISENIHGQTVNIEEMGHLYSGIEIRLPGRHQAKNLAVALSVIRILEMSGKISQIDTEALYGSIRDTRWPGRMEIITENPMTIIDGAHNPDGAGILREAIERYLKGKKINLVFGMLSDKDIYSVAEILVPCVQKVIITEPESPRAANVKEVHDLISKINKSDTVLEIIEIPQIKEAVNYAQKTASEDEVVVYAGSLYMIGKVRTLLNEMYHRL